MNKLLICGFGYTASILARKFASKDFQIIGTTSDEQKKILASKFVNIINHRELRSLLKNSKQEITHVMLSAPPSDRGDPFFLDYQNDISKMKTLKWIGYLSATNVYGDHNGEYVNEFSLLKGDTSKGINRIKAENQWTEFCKKEELPLHIFRIAGIYGPERNTYERIKSKKFNHIVKNNQYFSRIYITDLVNILFASMSKPNPINIYNVADDMPSGMSDVVDFICQRTSCTIPEKIFFEDLDRKQQQDSFYSENKRINNRLLKEDLGIILEYPSYREGYEKIIKNDN